jgi:hypothetical protein
MPTSVAAIEAKRASRIRAGLLVGASALAIVALSPRALADSTPVADPPPKWLPNISVSGQGGSHDSNLHVTGFDPFWQDSTSLIFARISLGTPTSHKGYVGNFGLGYRTQFQANGEDWIAGVFGGFDIVNTKLDKTYTQASLGAEIMNADWDARINGYLATQTHAYDIPGKFQLYLHDTRIAILQGQEAAYSGFDGEVGYRVFSTDDIDVRVFGGGYSFDRESTAHMSGGQMFHLGHDQVTGPMGRAEVEIYNVNIFGSKSRFTVSGKVTDDDLRGTSGYVGALLQIPIGAGGSAESNDEIDRRMVDPVRRQDDILTEFAYTKPEPVIIYNGTITSEPTNTLYYVDNSLGAGSYADPTTLKDATGRGPVNQFVVLTDREGTVQASGVTVQHGESVVGPGTFDIRGANSGAKFTHTFAPGSGPVTVNTADGITVQSDVNLYDFTLNSSATNAIYGHNVDDVIIANLTLNGSGGGDYGILFKQGSGSTGSVTIEDTTIKNFSQNGVTATVTGTSGTTAFTLDITHLTETGIGNDGVSLVAGASGTGTVNTNLTITNSSITAAGDSVFASSTATGAGAHATQTVVIDPTTIHGGVYGILVDNRSYGGTANSTVTLSDVNVSGVSYAGVALINASFGGTANQTATIHNLTVSGGGNTYYPVYIQNVSFGGTATQHVTATNLHVTNGRYDNITIESYGAFGGTSVQDVYMENVTSTGSVFGDGVFVRAESLEGGTAIQDVGLYGLTATGNGNDGLQIVASAVNYLPGDASTTHQYIDLFDADLSGNGFYGLSVTDHAYENSTSLQHLSAFFISADNNGGDGIYLDANASNYYAVDSSIAAQYTTIAYASASNNGGDGIDMSVSGEYQSIARQDLTLRYATADNNAYDGFRAVAFAAFEGASEQHVNLIYDDFNNNAGDGAAFDSFSFLLGSVQQNAYILGGSFNDNANDGIYIGATTFLAGQVQQNVGIYDVVADGNGRDGLEIRSYAYGYAIGFSPYYSHVGQNVIAAYSDFSANQRNGVEIQNYAGYGAQINQFVYLFDDSMNSNGPSSGPVPLDAGNGVYENSRAESYGFFGGAITTNLYSDLYIVHSYTLGNAIDGIRVQSAIDGPGYLIQHVIAQDDFSLFNGRSGFVDSATATNFYSLNIQYVTLANSVFGDNGLDGAAFLTTQSYGPLSFGAAIQDVTIVNSALSYNGRDGLYAVTDASAFQGRAEQHFTIQGSYFDGNGADGAFFANSAHDGVYVAGYPCTTTQGLTGGCAFVRQTVQAVASDFSYNGGDGIYVGSFANNYGAVYNSGGRPVGTTLLTEYVRASYNGGNGLHIENVATNSSYIYSYALLLGSQFDNNSGDGVYVHSTADFNSAVLQGTVLAGLPGASSSAAGNGGMGVHIVSGARYGSGLLQNVGIYDSDISGNGGNNVMVYGHAGANSGLAQSFTVYNAAFNGSTGGDGVYLTQSTTGPSSTVVLTGSIYYAAMNGNRFDGLTVAENAANGGKAYEQLSIYGSSFDGNTANGLHIETAASGGGYVYAYNVAANSTVDHNTYDGIYVHSTATGAGSGILSITGLTGVNGVDSSASYNGGSNIHAVATAAGGGTVLQGVGSYYSYLRYAHGSNILFTAGAFAGSTAGQYLYLDHADVDGSATGSGIYVSQTAQGAGAAVGLYSKIYYSDISVNHYNGMRVGESVTAGGSARAITYMVGNRLSYNHANGLLLTNYAGVAGSYVYSQAIALATHIDHNGYDGIYVSSVAEPSGTVVQETVLAAPFGGFSSASYNGFDGVRAISQAVGGTVQQLVGVYDSFVTGNHNAGLVVSGLAYDNGPVSTVGQYVYVSDSTVSANQAGYGIELLSKANGGNAIAQQVAYIGYDNITGNAGGGLWARAAAYNGASANQYLNFSADSIANNGGDGIYVYELSVHHASTQQIVKFNATPVFDSYIGGNTGDGIYVGAAAFEGAIAQQNAFLYYVDASNNGNHGLSVLANASGYYSGFSLYSSHITQNVVAGTATFNQNGGDGIHISDTAYYVGALNQFLYFSNVDASHNTGAGVHMDATLISNRISNFGYATDLTTSLYLINSSFDYNGASGIDLKAHAYGPVSTVLGFGGYSYLIQHNIISGSEANHNAGDGLYVRDYAQGRYVLDAQYFTISGSAFDHNTGAGASFLSSDTYGPGGFGDTFQQITISGSSFSYNGFDGLDLTAIAAGRQGRAEQHVTITGSTIDHNTGDGVHVYARATGGVYIAGHPCDTVQGLAGGCAFVRQNVNIEGGSDVSYNGGNGIFVGTYTNGYSAIYGASGRPHSPTLLLYGATVNDNGARGLDVSNQIHNSSYLFQYIAGVDVTLDHNASDGVYSASYAGGNSVGLQFMTFYSHSTPTGMSYNGGSGFKDSIETLGGSYMYSGNYLHNLSTIHNGSWGADFAIAYADASSKAVQKNFDYFTSATYNGDGLGNYSIGAGAYQYSYFQGDNVLFNSFVGVYGEANFGSFQYVLVYNPTFPNFVAFNGTNYLFNAFGGATQILN